MVPSIDVCAAVPVVSVEIIVSVDPVVTSAAVVVAEKYILNRAKHLVDAGIKLFSVMTVILVNKSHCLPIKITLIVSTEMTVIYLRSLSQRIASFLRLYLFQLTL